MSNKVEVIHSKVAGTSFREFDHTVINAGDELIMIRDPFGRQTGESHDDAAAFALYHDGDELQFIGYIKKNLAKDLAVFIDNDGGSAKVEVADVLTGKKNLGINIKITLEHTNMGYLNKFSFGNY